MRPVLEQSYSKCEGLVEGIDWEVKRQRQGPAVVKEVSPKLPFLLCPYKENSSTPGSNKERGQQSQPLEG
jgi:hypothetical protein